jgi:hypothetical protein
VTRWWRKDPNANIGVRVPDDVVVLDLDPRNGDALDALARFEADNGPIVTRTMMSGRGDGGRHYWFAHPGGELDHSRLPDGWDVKTSSGYEVVPPSVHPATGGRYRWDDPAAVVAPLPGWLAALLTRRTPVPSVSGQRRTRSDVEGWSASGLVATVATAPPTTRNDRLNWAAYRLGIDYRNGRVARSTMLAAADELHEAAVASGLSEREVVATIRSALRGAFR